MALTIVVRTGDSAHERTITFDAPRIVIGRAPGCEVRLPDSSVSHRHASLRQRGIDYILADEGSTNGTFVGQVRLPPHTPRVVRTGDCIRVGRVWLEIRVEQAPPTANPQLATQDIALALLADALRTDGQPAEVKLTVVAGPDAGLEVFVPMQGPPLVIGRTPGSGMILANAGASRRHCEVYRSGTHLMVRDLGSKNGTRLGDSVLPPNKEVVWRPDRLLVVGLDRISQKDAVTEALVELEREADERIPADEPLAPCPPGMVNGVPGPPLPMGSVPPPAQQGASVPPGSPAVSNPPGPPPGMAAPQPGGGAPIAAVPNAAPPSPVSKRRWSITDWLVALFALVVLLVSIVGLYLLFSLE